jgi:hypothetical protein
MNVKTGAGLLDDRRPPRAYASSCEHRVKGLADPGRSQDSCSRQAVPWLSYRCFPTIDLGAGCALKSTIYIYQNCPGCMPEGLQMLYASLCGKPLAY